MWTVAARRRLLLMRRGERHECPALAHSHQRREVSATRFILVPWCWRLRSVACSAACWKGEGKSLMRRSDFRLHPFAWDRLTQLFLGRVVRTEWDCWTFERTCGGVASAFCARVTQHPAAQCTLGMRLRQQMVTKIMESRELTLRHRCVVKLGFLTAMLLQRR